MHTKPMKDSEGDFGEWCAVVGPSCPYCKTDGAKIMMRRWESHCGGYVDHQFLCQACGKVWWIEGSDS